MNAMRVFPMGDKALTIEFGDTIELAVNAKVRAMHSHMQKNPIEGVVETVVAFRSLMVYYRTEIIRYEALVEKLRFVYESIGDIVEPLTKIIEVPVCYGGEYGPDLEEVAEFHGITVEEVIKRHTSCDQYVFMLAFTPGTATLGNIEETFKILRRPTPRVKLPAGAVGIVGNQTTFYSVESPGGWNIIGQSPMRAFDVNRTPMTVFAFDEIVRFVSVTPEEYKEIEALEHKNAYHPKRYERGVAQ